jgi:UDP-N-acetylglucosamine diphosphorylase/glucosamine-1-phosphate N-acetyltransferase
MHLCLFEDETVSHLQPLIHTRAAYDLRIGGRTLLQTARDAFSADGLVLHSRSLVAGVTAFAHPEAIDTLPTGADVLFVNGRFVAEEGPALARLQQAVANREPARIFLRGDTLVAAWMPNAAPRLPDAVLADDTLTAGTLPALPTESVPEATLVGRLWHLLDVLPPALRRDFEHATRGTTRDAPLPDRLDVKVHPSVVAVRPQQIFLAPGVEVRPGTILNAADGPIYVGEDATIYEQAVVRGPCWIGSKSQVKGGANIEGAAVGHYCKIGGEVHSSVLHSLSNKSHAGFLGDSYLGRWCNLGADTNVSNLKNDYGEVSVYDAALDGFVGTGRQFTGLFMGDHSKCGINTMFNTGTVVGTSCNLYGSGFVPRVVPSFAWGGPEDGFETYRLDKALDVAEAVMARRDTPLTDADRALLTALFERTAEAREQHLA